MEALTRLVSESLARHGFDRPVDYRRLRWSQWFRCESHHSLLSVPSKPGVFALAEEIIDFGKPHVGTAAFGNGNTRVGADAFVRPAERSSAVVPEARSQEPEAGQPRRLLAVIQFFEDDDMAFILDRMLSGNNPMRARLVSGRYFVRFVVIEDESQRRSISSALNQWIANAGEKASGIGAHFASSLEFTDARVGAEPLLRPASRVGAEPLLRPASEVSMTDRSSAAPHLDSGAATNLHCPSPFPSGF